MLVFPSKIYSNRPWSWLEKYYGLVYSDHHSGTYCKFCVLFAGNRDARITSYGVLVNSPLTNLKKATMKLSNHFGKTNYHAEAVQLASNFIDIMSGCTQPVSNQLVPAQVQEVKENR